MTSRFGKTYSRKGGEGTSKFDEVLSTKRGTLSTKWGDTTYKAKVGAKRAGAPKNDSVLEVYKRPRPSADGFEDPFGFDSDEESKPVSSRGGNKSSPAKPGAAEPPRAERPGLSLQAASRPAGDRKQPGPLEDTARFFNSSKGNTVGSGPGPALVFSLTASCTTSEPRGAQRHVHKLTVTMTSSIDPTAR